VDEDLVRVLRVIEIRGPRKAVEKQVENSLHGKKTLRNGVVITAATVEGYPEIIESAAEVEEWNKGIMPTAVNRESEPMPGGFYCQNCSRVITLAQGKFCSKCEAMLRGQV